MKETVSSIVNFGMNFADGMNKRRLTVYATSGCYYLFMSLVPIVMITCCILPYTPYNLATVLKYIDHYFAKSLADIMRNIASAVYTSNSATLTVSILLALFSASASMKALMKGMDSAYECDCHDNIIWFTIRALFYMILLVATLLLSLIIMVYGGRILDLLKEHFEYLGVLDSLLSQSRYVMVMMVLTVVFIVLYRVMPSGKVRILDQIPGAVFSAVTWVIFSWAFTIYIGLSNKFGAYGFIGTIMVAMLWMRYCLFFLLIGGYMNSYLTHLRVKKQDQTAMSDSYEIELPEPVTWEESTTLERGPAVPYAEVSSEEETDSKKKKTIPLIIGAIVCAVAAFAAAFFIKEKKKKSAPKKNMVMTVVTKLSQRKKKAD